MAYAIRHHEPSSTASAIEVLAGIWLLISPFVFAFYGDTGALTNNIVLGAVIAILALYRCIHPRSAIGVSWVNMVLGGWVLFSPWVVGFGMLRWATNTNVTTGVIVIILAGWSSLLTNISDDVNSNMDVTPHP